MFLLRFFLATVVALLWCPLMSFGQSVDCSELLKNPGELQAKLNALSSVPQRNRPVDPWDLRLAGELFPFGAAKSFSWEREGNYPILIFADGAVMISHRLPLVDVDPNLNPYLGNHLSLYQQRLRLDGQKTPAVVFAGHIRVVGRKPVRLVDQSGHFHEVAKDRRSLSQRNQNRLELARLDLHLTLSTPLDLEILNLQKRALDYHDDLIPDGHMTDRELALFELRCRKDVQCWRDYQEFQDLLTDLMSAGSPQARLAASFPAFQKAFGMTGFNYISTLNEALSEGALDVLAREDFQSLILKDWRLALPEIRHILLLERAN